MPTWSIGLLVDNEGEKGGEKVKKGLLAVFISLVLLFMVAMPALPALAADPEVTITVTAQVVSITNSKASWAIGNIVPDAVVYFSTDGTQDDDWSMIINAGNVTVDVEIQGTDFEGGDYDWTLATSAGAEQYSLYVNDSGTPTVYDVEVKSSSYNDITTSLADGDNVTWSANFTAPTGFNAADDGAEKSATVTLVASVS